MPANNCSAAKNTASNTQSLRWEWRMTPMLLPSAFGVFLFCGKIRGFFAHFCSHFQNLRGASSPQVQNSHTQKSLHSEVDKPVYKNCPSKMQNHLSVTLPHHDLKTAAESVADRQLRGGKWNYYASDVRKNRSCTKKKLWTWEKWRQTLYA